MSDPINPNSTPVSGTDSRKSKLKKKAKWPLWKKIAVTGGIIVLLIVIGIGTYASFLISKANNIIETVGTKEVVAPKDSAKVKPISILLMGVDSRKETGSLNSDVMMAISMNPETKSATIVSLPRDLEMKLKKNGDSHKANYFYPHFTLTEPETAMKKTKEFFGNFFEIPFDYMVTIDFEGFKQVVDQLGGVTVDVDQDMYYVDNWDGTRIDLKKGVQKLDGKKTLDFVRYRKSNPGSKFETQESSDPARNARQQQVLNEILKNLKSLGGVTKASGILEAVGNNLKTDIPASQIHDMISQYITIDTQNIELIHMDGDWISPYIVVKDEEIREAKNALKLRLDPNWVPSSSPNSTDSSKGSDNRGNNTNSDGKITPTRTPKPTDAPTHTPKSTIKPTPTPTPKTSVRPNPTPEDDDVVPGLTPDPTRKPGGSVTPPPSGKPTTPPKNTEVPKPTPTPTPQNQETVQKTG
ncbi:hypothetical protein YDYSY3_09320 [Paenibacillus chitinolyticus]|nr:hypothetical protein YDYSY3_09320 [Paenibacillus chitinolyticus]